MARVTIKLSFSVDALKYEPKINGMPWWYAPQPLTHTPHTLACTIWITTLNNVMFTCRSHLASCGNRFYSCFSSTFCLFCTYHSPLGSFYPIKFIRSNMWMWHQRQRQLCDLHFVFECMYVCDFWLFLLLLYLFQLWRVVASFFVTLHHTLRFSFDRRLVYVCVHMFSFELLMFAASRVIFVNFSTLYCFAFVTRLDDSYNAFGLMVISQIKWMPQNENWYDWLKTASPEYCTIEYAFTICVCDSHQPHRFGQSPTNLSGNQNLYNIAWEIMKCLCH